MAHFITNDQPTSLVQLNTGAQMRVQLWGRGPNGERLDVGPSDPNVFRVEEIQASFGPDPRSFSIRGLQQGSARLYGRVGPSGPIWADTRVMVGYDVINRYYHATNSAIADNLMRDDLTPHIVPAALVTTFDWTDYNDFGKGFYVHYESNKTLAYEWARREFRTEWAVVEFIATPDELRDLAPTSLTFQNKSDRPHNAPRPVIVTTTTRTVELCPVPQLLPCLRVSQERTTRTSSPATMSWLEFVEYNRHIDRRQPLIAKPKDRDWTGTYSSMRGPLWRPRDSGYDTGGPIFPDHIHQLNWGLDGMAVLNVAEVKIRRFKFGAHNEGIFPPPASASAAHR